MIQHGTLDKNGFIKAARFEIIGGLGSNFLKADGSSDSTTYSNLGDITGTAGTLPDLNLAVA
jgi:hypothetical protein